MKLKITVINEIASNILSYLKLRELQVLMDRLYTHLESRGSNGTLKKAFILKKDETKKNP